MKLQPNQLKNVLENFATRQFWLVGSVGKKKGRSGSKLSLPYFLVKKFSQTKFHQNRLRNVEVGKFHYKTILVGRAGRSKNGYSGSKLSLPYFLVKICSQTKFHQNRLKNVESTLSAKD